MLCATAADFSAVSAAVTSECCDEPTESCDEGTPETCNAGCAAVLVPANAACTAKCGFLPSSPTMNHARDIFTAAAAKCPT